MCFYCDLKYWERQGDIDLANGDYVVLNRRKERKYVHEEIITFSNIRILRVLDYANDASTRGDAPEDCEEGS